MTSRPGRAYAHPVIRAGFAAVALAAGIAGVALLATPDRTGDFFSWKLDPPPLASLIGGFYIASSVVFGVAMFVPAAQVRGLLAASLLLTVPTAISTMIHLEVFDLGRWQAWFWIVLFLSAPLFWLGSLFATPPLRSSRERPRPSWWLLGLALLLAGFAVAVWLGPVSASSPLPFDFSPMGGRFVGAWLGFLSFLAAWAGPRDRDHRFAIASIAVFFGGALVAGVRSFGDLGPASARAAYFVALGAALVVTSLVARRTPSRVRAPTGARGS